MIVRQPDKVHTAFNPIVFEVQTPLKEVEMDVRIEDQITRLKKEVFNGRAIFDISPIIRQAFREEVIRGNRTYWEDKYLSLNYSVKLEDRELYYTALNAVVQAGESSSLVERQGNFLTKFERLRFYEGYERVISVLGFENANYYNFSQETQKLISLNGRVYNLNLKGSEYLAISNGRLEDELLTTNNDEVITDNLGNPIVIIKGITGEVIKRKYIDSVCVPENPFYVRWVNVLGGRDYWMFGYRQYESKTIMERKEFMPYSDSSEVKGFVRDLSLKGRGAITAGAGNLNSNEYEALSDIIYSPMVEYFNEELGLWIEVKAEEVELNGDNRSYVHSIELKFILPTRQLQF